ncbi:hypothetical protein OPT61_g8273 [Boeremia exigua]|uniref:Uncharacterized protein n=1 Tax=Boeremia exigua TaxID=749465 RepID=A0ACC2HZT6_9PLEO|nr:hypothetical protein OPT61_g8273 [Boeremia exigua]
MRQFRHPKTIRRLWADAQCVNQMDVAEKSSQVRAMGKTYRDAKKVLVWLGDDHDGIAKDCFDMIRTTNTYLDDLFVQCHRMYAWMPRLEEPHPIPLDRKPWAMVDVLTKLPWFIRAWTVQEFETSDPRDYVFAFFGCPFGKNTANDSIIEVDYSLSREELWHRVACTLVKDPTEGASLLNRVKHEHRDVISRSHRPSWIPYWDKIPQLGTARAADPNLRFNAGGPLHHFNASPGKGRTLQLHGFIFWKSVTIVPKEFSLHRFRNQETCLSEEPLIDRLWRETSLAAEARGHKMDEDSFAMTLLSGGRDARFDGEKVQSRLRTYLEVVRSEYGGMTSTNEPSAPNAEPVDTAVIVMNRLNYTGTHKCVFLTRNGRLGLGRGDLVEVGDLCCIFSGATVPFLLTPARNRWHKLVDECYIYGAMKGELLEEYELGTILLE